MTMNEEQKKWPMLLDMTKDECKQSLRSLELLTYSQIVSVLRAQGEFTKEKRKLLSELQMVFSISVERHRAEIRRAVNDEVLNTIAETLAGPNTNIEWAIEGRRLIPLMPRVPPQIAYTALATKMAQQYCGLNASLPDPCETAMYGKLDDVGAESDMTDSEEETEGLRFITESMIPPQYNINQGPYSVLPLSQARLHMERLKEKKDSSAEELSQDAPASPTQLSSSVSSGSSASNASHGKPPLAFGAEKRKRKRSFSFDHPPAHSPPPPPLPSSTPPTSVGAQLSTQSKNTPTTIWQPTPSIANSSLKITMTGGMTRSSSASPLSTNSQQKVILVSTSAASGSVANIYQRSISVPILKSPQGGTGSAVTLNGSQISQGNLLRCSVANSSASSVSGNLSIVNKLRPRFSSSISTSILSTGSSSLPGLPPRPLQRQRSNSLILQNEGEIPSRLPSAPSTGQNIASDNVGNPLNFIGSNVLQLRSNPAIAPKPPKSSNIQVKQEGGKLVTHSIMTNTAPGTNISSSIPTCTSGVSNTLPNVVGGRIIGRTTLPPSSQGLYMVSTSSGTITVVTRTVASASISNPRVVTVNTINNSRPSIVRGGPPTTPGVALGVTPKTLPSIRPGTNIRPVMSGPKSNVIVVHKGTIATAGRPVGIQGLRDLSTKIISKPPTQGPSGTTGLLSGTLIVKPSPVSSKGAATSLINTTKDTVSPATVNSIASSISSSSSLTSVGNGGGGGVCTEVPNNNLIVVDLGRESSLASQNAPAALANILHTPGIAAASGTKNGSTSSHSFLGNKVFLETNSLSSQSKKEPHHGSTLSSSSSSHDISTVSASSSLPSSFRSVKPSPDTETTEETPEAAPCQEKESRTSFSNIVSSSSDVKEVLDESLQEHAKVSELHHSSFSLREEEGDDEEDNEWVKLGLEEDEVEMEEEEEEEDEEVEEEERSSEISSCTEKSTFPAEDSLENEVEDKPPKSVTPPGTMKEREDEKSAASEPSVSSSTEEPVVEKEQQLQMLVEKAVEVLKGGDSDQARSLLYKAGFELIDSSGDPNQTEGQDGFSISNIAGVSSSSGILGSTTPLSASTPLRDESSLGSMSELDPATGYFYSPAGGTSGENSSERASNKADSPASKDEDSLSVSEFEEN